MGVQADYRAAAIALVDESAQGASIRMQVYPGRPASIYTPTGFVDAMGNVYTPVVGSSDLFNHAPRIELMLLWGLFDSKEAVDQRDLFVDAFHEYIRTRAHQVSGRSLISPVTLDDVPTFVPDWLPEDQQRTYFGSRLVLEGQISD